MTTEEIRDGLHVYIGTTGTGKTHKAIRDAITLARQRGVGVLVIDSRGAENLKDIPEYRVDMDLAHAVWQGKVCRVVPADKEEFNRLMMAVDKVGQCVVLIDECATWATDKTFLALCRVWRHRKVSLFLTTQKVGFDLQQSVLACDPVLWIFRTTAPTTIDWLERWHGIDPNVLRNMGVGEFLLRGF